MLLTQSTHGTHTVTRTHKRLPSSNTLAEQSYRDTQLHAALFAKFNQHQNETRFSSKQLSNCSRETTTLLSEQLEMSRGDGHSGVAPAVAPISVQAAFAELFTRSALEQLNSSEFENAFN